MSQLNNSQTLGYQLEKVRDKVTLWFQRDSTLWDQIKKRGDVEVVSSRNMRIPVRVLAGGKFLQVSADGGDFGRGSGTTTDVAQVTPIYFAQATEYTKEAEVATDSKQKAVEDVAKTELQSAIEQMRTNIEALLNTDGSGTLDSVTAISGSVLTVNNANQFYDNQDIQVWSALGGTNRGTATVQSVDALNKQLTLSAAPPAGTAVNDLLIVNGAPGTAGGSLFGLEYHQVNSNTGTWLQLSRSTYPGKISTPTVNLSNGPLTVQSVRLAKQLVRRALGADVPDLDQLCFHMNLDMESAWENIGLVVAETIQNQIKGDTSIDMLPKKPAKTMGGYPIIASIHAKPGRIDGLCLKHWGRAETQPIDYLEFGGQTIFPVYGASGGLSAASIFYFWTGFQVFTDLVRAGVFLQNVQVPANY